MRTDLDPIGAVYEERNCLALAFARMARAAGWVVGWVDDDDAGRDWPVLMIDTPAGQVSWHLPRLWIADYEEFGRYPGEWDGHSTPEKYQRLGRLGVSV
jgi:hypothetical protein